MSVVEVEQGIGGIHIWSEGDVQCGQLLKLGLPSFSCSGWIDLLQYNDDEMEQKGEGRTTQGVKCDSSQRNM